MTSFTIEELTALAAQAKSDTDFDVICSHLVKAFLKLGHIPLPPSKGAR